MRIEGRKKGGEEGVIWRRRRRPACRLLRQALSRNAETPSASCAPPSTGWLPLLCSEIQTKSQTNTETNTNTDKYRNAERPSASCAPPSTGLVPSLITSKNMKTLKSCEKTEDHLIPWQAAEEERTAGVGRGGSRRGGGVLKRSICCHNF